MSNTDFIRQNAENRPGKCEPGQKRGRQSDLQQRGNWVAASAHKGLQERELQEGKLFICLADHYPIR